MLYTDLGSPYRARAIQRAASLIGCYVHHTEVRDPQAKGKVERIMQQFTNRLELELQAIGKPPTLAELNEYAVAYVEVEYHQRRHSTTGESPHDRYNRLPMESRRLISADTLALVFLPCETAKVSTDGIIRFNKSRYLVPASLLRNKQVEIRYDPEDLSRLHVWYADKYHGEATLYAANNDYQFRESVWSEEEVPAPVTTDKHLEVPYTRMQRIIDEYRRDQQVMAKDIDEELAHSRVSGHMMQATSVVPHGPSSSDVFGLDSCTYLLGLLLHRQLSAVERLQVSTAWKTYGPFTEACVRRQVGTLLGQSHPVQDLEGYLDAIIQAHLEEA